MMKLSNVMLWAVVCASIVAGPANAGHKIVDRRAGVASVLYWEAPLITVTAHKARKLGVNPVLFWEAPMITVTGHKARKVGVNATLFWEAPMITVTGHKARNCVAGRRRPAARAGDCARAPPMTRGARPR